jgi:hypothetical protein
MEDTLKRILRIIPGYKGYEAKENRRDADHTLRTTLAREFTAEQQTITNLTKKAVDHGRFDYLDRLEEINQSLGHFIARLESAPRGYAGWFNEVKIEETDLDQIYAFDAKLADSLPLLREYIGHVQKEFTDGINLDEAMDELAAFVGGLHIQFNAREAFVLRGKQPAA